MPQHSKDSKDSKDSKEEAYKKMALDFAKKFAARLNENQKATLEYAESIANAAAYTQEKDKSRRK